MKSKLSKQQKKYIKACDSKELRKELKGIFKKLNKNKFKIKLNEGAELIRLNTEYLNNVLENSSDLKLIQDLKVICVENGEYEFSAKFRNKEKQLEAKSSPEKLKEEQMLKSMPPNANTITKETLESLTNPDLIKKGKDFEKLKLPTIEFDLPKIPHKDKKGNMFLDSGIFQSETFNDEVLKISKFHNDKILEELVNYTPPDPNKVKKYTEEDMEKCFNESRFTHPVIGFKHTNFSEYLKLLENEK